VGETPQADQRQPDLMQQQHDDALSFSLLLCAKLLAYACLSYRDFFLSGCSLLLLLLLLFERPFGSFVLSALFLLATTLDCSLSSYSGSFLMLLFLSCF
jgi:hypothetical protein